MSSSLQLSEEGIKIAQEAFRRKYPSHEALAKELSEVHQCEVTRQPIGRFLNGESISRQRFVWICEALDIDVNTVVKPLSESKPETTAIDYWQKICHERLEAQKQNLRLRQKVTQIGCELDVHVPLGLFERKQPPRRSNNDSRSPEQGSGFFQPTQEEIIKKYQHDDFLKEVIKQGQSKSQGKRIAIIGEPGAGKTTLLEAIAFCKNFPYLPIWISLRSLGEKSLEEYLCQKWLKDALKTSDVTQQQKELEELFKSGQVLLLLDGVDEMPASSPVEALAKIREELTGWVADARVVLTCRVNVWDASVNALQGFDTYRTLEFSYGDGNKPDQVREFICQWFSKADKPELGEPLREKLDKDRHQRIRDLVKNPLRLSLLCQSWYFHQGDLPKTKAALYEQFTEAFYDWKEEQFPTTPTKRKELNEKLGLLAREAIAKEKSRFGIRESFAIDVMGEDLFNLACKLHWLNFVYKDTETDEKVYTFFHPTFQEYFAACVIDDWHYFLNHNNENPNPFLKHNGKDCVYRIFEPQWKQVILLWLGRPEEEVPKEQKEAFIQVLLEFEDGCLGLYRYIAHFLAAAGIPELKDYIYADEIVGMLVDWYAGAEIWTYMTVVNPVIANEARVALLETDRTTVIKVLMYVLNSDFVNDDSRWKVFNLLEQIGRGNSEVVAGLTKLIDNSIDDEELQQNAAFFLGRIDPGNQKAINLLTQQLLKKTLPDWLDWLPRRAAYFLGTIDQPNQDAINYLTKLINQNEKSRFEAASTLGKIDPGNPIAIKTLTELLNTERGDRVMNIPLIAACDLLETDPENPDAISFLREFIKSGRFLFLWERLEAASALGKTQQYKQEAIKVLCELISETIRTEKERQLLQQACERLKQLDSSILYSLLSWQQENFLSRGINVTLENENGWACILALTKHYLEEENCLEEIYYEDIWHCAQFLNYPDFYRAWHSRVYGTRTEKGEDITVIEFNTVQTSVQALENQLINISSKVQPTDKTYPITLDTQSLKLEINTSAIAQKICTKIYRKAGYSEIPTVSDAAQLQQYIPRIQEQLQKPNIALILHRCEPNEHLLNFCYSLADEDIGLYIGLITSQPLEQPLKGFLPEQPNLLSAIQSWIDELS